MDDEWEKLLSFHHPSSPAWPAFWLLLEVRGIILYVCGDSWAYIPFLLLLITWTCDFGNGCPFRPPSILYHTGYYDESRPLLQHMELLLGLLGPFSILGLLPI